VCRREVLHNWQLNRPVLHWSVQHHNRWNQL